VCSNIRRDRARFLACYRSPGAINVRKAALPSLAALIFYTLCVSWGWRCGCIPCSGAGDSRDRDGTLRFHNASFPALDGCRTRIFSDADRRPLSMMRVSRWCLGSHLTHAPFSSRTLDSVRSGCGTRPFGFRPRRPFLHRCALFLSQKRTRKGIARSLRRKSRAASP